MQILLGAKAITFSALQISSAATRRVNELVVPPPMESAAIN